MLETATRLVPSDNSGKRYICSKAGSDHRDSSRTAETDFFPVDANDNARLLGIQFRRIADQVAINPFKADLSERERAIVDFALLVCSAAGSITDADIDDMRQKGFTDDEIWDIGAITAFFAMSNRLANLSSMRPNDEFYSMAR